jgi:20S proteasome alpha/beta subunit
MLPTVVRAVDSAMKRDTASGDSFDVVIIDGKGFHELDEKEKAGILATS